jgi:hypothetical protein
MEILWTAMGICVIVCFVFFVLAQHWQRVLRRQALTIRRLADRLQEIEQVDDPEFRRRLEQSTPMPLEQVFTFSFRLSDRFWTEALQLREDDLDYIRKHGSFVGSVKLERWRSHAVATITEVLPASESAHWQTRTLDFYPGTPADSLTLWELRLARPSGSAERPPSLELILRGDSLDLCADLPGSSHAPANGEAAEPEGEKRIFLRVPLEAAKLAEFRSYDPLIAAGNGNGDSNTHSLPSNGSSWRTFYAGPDEGLGVEWQLWLRDLTKKAEWERWKILETTGALSGSAEN